MKTKTKVAPTKATKLTDKSVKLTEFAKEVNQLKRLLSQANTSGTKLTESVRQSLAKDNGSIVCNCAVILYHEKGSQEPRLQTLMRTIKRVSRAMSNPKSDIYNEGQTPVKLKLGKEGTKENKRYFYQLIDNTTTEADKFQLLINHIKREVDNLSTPQKAECIDLLK